MNWSIRYAYENNDFDNHLFVPGEVSNENTPVRNQNGVAVPRMDGTPLHKLKPLSTIPFSDGINNLIKSINGKSESTVRIYRAVPKNVSIIFRGDYVTTDINRARQIANNMDRNAITHILHADVPSKHLISQIGMPGPNEKGSDPHYHDRRERLLDFGYYPDTNK